MIPTAADVKARRDALIVEHQARVTTMQAAPPLQITGRCGCGCSWSTPVPDRRCPECHPDDWRT